MKKKKKKQIWKKETKTNLKKKQKNIWKKQQRCVKTNDCEIEE